MDTVILGNGEYLAYSMPEAMLIMAPHVVRCDRSTDEHIHQGLIPNAIIGDGDSLPAENKDRFREIFHQIDDQEINDQTKTVHFLLDQGEKVITLVGATGKREDHTLGDISLLVDYMKVGTQVTMLIDYGMFIPALGRNTLKSRPGQQVSVFNLGAAGLRGKGLVCPFNGFDSQWRETLNEAAGGEFTIHAEGNYLVYLSH